MRFIQILPRTDGDNTRRVDGLVAAEIVGANMVEVDRLRDARHLVDVAQETMQVQVVADAVLVALKVGDIDRIKANQRGPQANVRFRQAIARQVAMLAQICSVRSSDSNTFPTASSYASGWWRNRPYRHRY